MPSHETHDINKLIKKKGSENAKTFLAVLAKNSQFKSAIETPIGFELLKDIADGIESRLNLIIKEEDTPEIRAEIRAYRGILNKWSGRINEADKGQMEFNRITERI